MKFLLISGSKARKEVSKHLISEAKKYFSTVLSIPLDGIRVECVGGENKLFFKNTDLTKFDACYARLFSEDFLFGECVLDILESSGVYLPTSSEAFQIVNHKYYTVQTLCKSKLPVPTTSLSVSPQPTTKISRTVGYPLVVKLLSGFGGRGVMLVQEEQDLVPLLDTMQVFKEFVATQEFIDKGDDIRCYVIGDNVYPVKRIAKKGEWRANVSRGARAIPTRIPDEIKEIALKAAKIMGMDISSVDFIKSSKGWLILEINFSPGLMPKFFGKKFAEIIMKHIFNRTKEIKLLP